LPPILQSCPVVCASWTYRGTYRNHYWHRVRPFANKRQPCRACIVSIRPNGAGAQTALGLKRRWGSNGAGP
jgi:hypothetical protein